MDNWADKIMHLFCNRLRLYGLFAFVFLIMSSVAHAGERTLWLYFTHTKEELKITYKKDGKFIPAALKRLNKFLRDWRRNESTKMDPMLFDVIWDVYQISGSKKPVTIYSAYRSPRTNNMLRSRSRGVARNSQHPKGKAVDFFLPDVSSKTLRNIGMRLQAGGVGHYNGRFVHLDTGRVRHWPRLNRRTLVKIFPKGGTLHVPSDGKPLSGHKRAVAMLKKTGRGAPKPAFAVAIDRRGQSTRPTRVARIASFGENGDSIIRSRTNTTVQRKSPVTQDKPDVKTTTVVKEAAPAPARVPEAEKIKPVIAKFVPSAKPTNIVQIARLQIKPDPLERASKLVGVVDDNKINETLESSREPLTVASLNNKDLPQLNRDVDEKTIADLLDADALEESDEAQIAGPAKRLDQLRTAQANLTPVFDADRNSAINAAALFADSGKAQPPKAIESSILMAYARQNNDIGSQGEQPNKINRLRDDSLPKADVVDKPARATTIARKRLSAPIVVSAPVAKSEPQLLFGSISTHKAGFSKLVHPKHIDVGEAWQGETRAVRKGFVSRTLTVAGTRRFDGLAVSSFMNN